MAASPFVRPLEHDDRETDNVVVIAPPAATGSTGLLRRGDRART
jgi:hypothetical protein